MSTEMQHARLDVGGPLGIATINPPDLTTLDALTEDARRSGLDGDAGPPEPNDFFALRGRLQAVRLKMPPLYRDTFVDPFIANLDQLGEAGFTKVLLRDPSRTRAAGLMLDI